MTDKLDQAMALIFCELEKAYEEHGCIRSAHEGLGILTEEMEELKQEIFKKPDDRDNTELGIEAAHVAVVAIRILVDVVYSENRRT